ncbi:MAG: C10 family peptidase, partial [Lentisphaeria bacterium]|nr:C10 family peptidase [Lentisphaeria bacterium]
MALPDLQVFAYDDFTQPLMVSFDGGTTWSSPGQIEDGTGFYIGMRFGNFGGTDAQNVAFSLSLDGTAVLTQSLSDVVVDCYYTYTYGELSLAPGSHTFLLTVDPGNKIAESNESNNSYSWTITVSGSTAPYLMDTLWGQSDLLPGSDVYINAFAPIDPDTGTRSLTGCVNTAVAQVMSYFAQEGYGFTVTLDSADAFVSGGRIAITSAQFGQINDLLEDFDADSPLDIAALTFASGVILESSFGSAETSTSGSGKEVFMRAGFKSVSEAHKGFSDLWNGSSLSDKGWNMLKNNMAAGRPVLTSIPEPAHAVVIDGYDSLTDSVHINFGWGLFGNKKFDSTYGLDLGTGWYSRSECDNLGLRSFTYDITPDTTAPKVENIVCRYKAAYAELTLSVSDDVGVSKQFYRLTPSGEWLAFSGTLKVEKDGTVYFRVCDRAGNYSAEKTFLVEGLSSPLSLTVSKVPEAWTRQDVLLTASASGGKGELVIYFKTGDENWQLYSENVRLEENGTVFFKAVDSRGVESEIVERHVSCIDKEAPEIPSSLTETVDKQNVRLDWGISSDNGKAGTTGYYIRYGAAEALSGDGEFVSENCFSLENLDYGSWFYQIRSVDALGNLSEWSAVKMFDVLAPLLVTVEGLPEAWTRQDVLLTASASGGKGELVIYFKTGDENWQLYSENVRLEENGTVFFKAVDSRGVESEIV